jgi:hypothetical protein
VAQRYSIDAAGSALGAVVDGEDDGLALPERDDGSTRLHTGALLGEDELATGEVASGVAEEEGYLKREDERAVEILVEAVVVALLVLEQKWCGARLAGVVAELEEFIVGGGEFVRSAEGLVPLVGDEGERRIEAGAKRLYEWVQRVGVVLVLAAAEAVFGHDDAAAELCRVVIAGGELGALRGCEERAGGGEALVVEVCCDARPVERGDLFREVHRFTLVDGGMRGHSDL